MKHRGFALLFALCLLFVLTFLGFTALLISGGYYSSARNLFENENARLASEQASRMMIDRHNLGSTDPRFFFDPQLWISQQMVPLTWNGYHVNAKLKAPWQPASGNHLRLRVSRGRYQAALETEIRQIRFEDFAFYSEESVVLNQASMFHGRVLARNGLLLTMPSVRFRDLVHGEVAPEPNASFRVRSGQVLNFPTLNEFVTRDMFYDEAGRSGFIIAGADPQFWNGTRYVLDLDRLQLLREGSRWRVVYNATELGVSAGLHFWFDHDLAIKQGYRPLAAFDNKVAHPLYISSATDIYLESSLQSVESATLRHPLCIMASDAIYISSTIPAAARLKAMLISLGSDEAGGSEAGFIVESGGVPLPEPEKALIADGVNSSVFLVEADKKQELLESIVNNERVLWLRGPLLIQSSLYTPAELVELHFENTNDRYLFLPSFPFVKIVEGSSVWP